MNLVIVNDHRQSQMITSYKDYTKHMPIQYHLWVALRTHERRVMVHADTILVIDNVYSGVRIGMKSRGGGGGTSDLQFTIWSQ